MLKLKKILACTVMILASFVLVYKANAETLLSEKQVEWLNVIESSPVLEGSQDEDEIKHFIESIKPFQFQKQLNTMTVVIKQDKALQIRLKNIGWKLLDIAPTMAEDNFNAAQSMVMVSSIILYQLRPYFGGSDFKKIAEWYEESRTNPVIARLLARKISTDTNTVKPFLNALALPYAFEALMKEAANPDAKTAKELAQKMQALLKISSLESVSGNVLGDRKLLARLVENYLILSEKFPKIAPASAVPATLIPAKKVEKNSEITPDRERPHKVLVDSLANRAESLRSMIKTKKKNLTPPESDSVADNIRIRLDSATAQDIEVLIDVSKWIFVSHGDIHNSSSAINFALDIFIQFANDDIEIITTLTEFALVKAGWIQRIADALQKMNMAKALNDHIDGELGIKLRNALRKTIDVKRRKYGVLRTSFEFLIKSKGLASLLAETDPCEGALN